MLGRGKTRFGFLARQERRRPTGSAERPSSRRARLIPRIFVPGKSRWQAVEVAVKDGLVWVGELADGLQDFGRGRLSLQRLLGRVEQARVLDRDHRLVHEGLAACAIWCSVNAPDLPARHQHEPMESSSRISGKKARSGSREERDCHGRRGRVDGYRR